MKREALTDAEARTLNYIASFIADNGWPPSVREIGKGCGLKSSSTPHVLLRQLERKRYIKREAHSPRALKVVE